MAVARNEKEDALRWCSEQISSMLGFGDPAAAQEMALYIWGLETEDAMKDYMADLLGPQNRFSDRFVRDFFTRKREIVAKVAPPPGARVYRKGDNDDEFQFMMGGKQKKGQQQKQQEKQAQEQEQVAQSTGSSASASAASANSSAPVGDKATKPQPDAPISMNTKGKASKPKYVNFLSVDGQGRLAALVPGRKQCDCLAQKHPLINNCLACGRVVCAQEGAGPCFFCNSIVVTPQDQELLQRDSKQSRKAFEKMLKDWGLESYMDKDKLLLSALPDRANAALAESLAAAESRKNKLVFYDRNATSRTKVIDDEADYFTSDGNKWLTEEQKKALKDKEEALREKRREDKKKITLTLDFAGRRVIQDEHEPDEASDIYNPAVAEEVLKSVAKTSASSKASTPSKSPRVEAGSLADNPLLPKDAIHPHFVSPSSSSAAESAGTKTGPGIKASSVQQTADVSEKMKALSIGNQQPKSKSAGDDTKASSAAPLAREERAVSRIQDRELNEMSDEGMCMALHQPYAGLLTRGIMIHEGRVWYTPHRGRLYISAASKEPTPEEIRELEQYYGSPNPTGYNYPKEYPTSCLLGYVDVVDCLPQEEYRKRFPDGLSHSPFVFICENFHELLVKYPIKNQHKIFKLDKEMHQNAKKMARPSKTYV